MGIASNGQVEIYFETFGDPADPTLVLVNGLGSQCINFDEEFCRRFSDRGFRIVRFDNRDVGLSTKFDRFPPNVFGVIEALADGRDPLVAYRLGDMAHDVLVVLDDLGVDRAHVAGWSLGGMIAQQLALQAPGRLLSLTSVMSTTGDTDVGQPAPEVSEIVLGPSDIDRDSIIAKRLELERIIASPGLFDDERVARQTGDAYDRCFNLAGAARQLCAVLASGSRSSALRSLKVPALVIHGDRDRFIDVSGGIRTAECLPDARLEIVQGMGHDLNPAYWDRMIELIEEHARAASDSGGAHREVER